MIGRRATTSPGSPALARASHGHRHRRRTRRFAAIVAVDVAIVGGGITGAALAWRFADAGVRVALARSDADRARQHGREHRAADAGTRRGLRAPCATLRRRARAPHLGAQPWCDARLHRHAPTPEHPLRPAAVRLRVLHADTRVTCSPSSASTACDRPRPAGWTLAARQTVRRADRRSTSAVRDPDDGQRAGGSVSGVPGIHARGGGRGARVFEGSPVDRHRRLVATT